MHAMQTLIQRFESPVSGHAYRPLTRWMTFSFVTSLLAYGLHVLSRGPDVAGSVLGLMAAAAAVVLVGAWFIMTGRTTIDAQGIRQDGLFPRVFRWHEITRARFLKMPLSGRLLLSVGAGPIRAIHGGDDQLDAAFREIADCYRQAWER